MMLQPNSAMENIMKDKAIKAGVDVKKIPNEFLDEESYISKSSSEESQHDEISPRKWRDEFKRLDQLKVELCASGANTIYGNGRNQIGIIVRVKITGKNGHPMKLEPVDILEHITLCNYETGKVLDTDPDQPTEEWFFYTKPGKFFKPLYDPHSAYEEASADTTPESYDPDLHDLQNGVSGDGTVYVTLYLSSTLADETADIAAQLFIPGVGPFSSSKVSTSTNNAPVGQRGSIWCNPSFVTCYAHRPIDYSDPKNIKVTNAWKSFDNFEHKVKDMLIRNTSVGGSSSSHDGISSKAELKIKTKNGYNFKEKNVKRNEATNKFMDIRGHKNTADIIRGLGGNNYDIDLIFVECSNYGLNTTFQGSGHSERGILMESQLPLAIPTSWWYVIGQNDYRHVHHAELSDEYVLVSICNHRCPHSGLWQKDWSNSNNEVTVDVYDEYGNYGQLKISMDDQNWPQLKINGEHY
jgi:hypothetical protein